MPSEVCNKFSGHRHRCKNVAASHPDHFENVHYGSQPTRPCGKRIAVTLSKRFPGLYAARLRIYTPKGAMLEFETGLREPYAKKVLKQFTNAIGGLDPETGETIPSGDAAVDANNEGRVFDTDSYGRIYYICPGLDDEGDSTAPHGDEARAEGDHETRWPCLKQNANLVASRGVDGLHRPVFDIDNGHLTADPDPTGKMLLHRGDCEPLAWLGVRNEFINAGLASSDIGGMDVILLTCEAYKVDSSTSGHFHLCLGQPISWDRFQDLLTVMCSAGILQKGFVDHAISRRAAFVRTPWSKKVKPFRIKR